MLTYGKHIKEKIENDIPVSDVMKSRDRDVHALLICQLRAILRHAIAHTIKPCEPTLGKSHCSPILMIAESCQTSNFIRTYPRQLSILNSHSRERGCCKLALVRVYVIKLSLKTLFFTVTGSCQNENCFQSVW